MDDTVATAAANPLQLRLHRRKFDPDDDYFMEGNVGRYENFQRIYLPPASSIFSSVPGEVLSFLPFVRETFKCVNRDCNQTFDSLTKYEHHLFHSHRHQCATCKRSFTSDQFLSIHISEKHDTYFKLLSKKKPSFVCLVDGCTVLSATTEDRKKHLVTDHLYPTTYDFDFVGRGRFNSISTGNSNRNNTSTRKSNSTKVGISSSKNKGGKCEGLRPTENSGDIISQNNNNINSRNSSSSSIDRKKEYREKIKATAATAATAATDGTGNAKWVAVKNHREGAIDGDTAGAGALEIVQERDEEEEEEEEEELHLCSGKMGADRILVNDGGHTSSTRTAAARISATTRTTGAAAGSVQPQNQQPQHGVSDDGDMEIDGLVESMQQQARISGVPDKISFGRRSRGNKQYHQKN